jgi:ABC-2 type transport system ATP-binding protein
MTNAILLQVEHLNRRYGTAAAVHDFNLTLRRGEVLGLLGPNGAGKSTTLRLLAGCLAPDSGHIRIAGFDLLEQPRHAKARLGFLPEQPPLYPDLTVDEYLTYCTRLHRLAGATIRARVDDAKRRCGLGDVGGHLLGHLSKGYQQRAGIAQAILHAPDLILLDEPTVGLDPIQIRETRELIRELGREQSVILSTHLLSEVQAVCTRVLIIHQGRPVYERRLPDLAAPVLTVMFSHPPAVTALAALDGIETVEPVGNRFRLYPAPNADPVPELVAQAVEQGWGLRELRPDQGDLEQIFVDLILGHGAQML